MERVAWRSRGEWETHHALRSCIAVLYCCRVPRLFFYSIARLFEYMIGMTMQTKKKRRKIEQRL
jgi:hypothetical protein